MTPEDCVQQLADMGHPAVLIYLSHPDGVSAYDPANEDMHMQIVGAAGKQFPDVDEKVATKAFIVSAYGMVNSEAWSCDG